MTNESLSVKRRRCAAEHTSREACCATSCLVLVLHQRLEDTVPEMKIRIGKANQSLQRDISRHVWTDTAAAAVPKPRSNVRADMESSRCVAQKVGPASTQALQKVAREAVSA